MRTRRPSSRRTRLAGLVAVATLALVAAMAPPASAQATRTWVSGVGDDVNPCSRTAPCKTWAGAISKTATGGTIDAEDDGGFGAVAITKSITIDGGGHVASALNNGTNGFIVSGAGIDVVLRDVKAESTDCTGLNGVNILQAASVVLDGVVVSGSGTGINIANSAATGLDVSMSDVDLVGSCTVGVRVAAGGAGPARVSMDRTTFSSDPKALSVGTGGEVFVSNSTFASNTQALEITGSGKIHSLCGNVFSNNTANGQFTDETGCGTGNGIVVVAPPTPAPIVPAAATYCVVPNLKNKTAAQATALLTSAGCTIGKVKKKSAPKKKQKKVLTQAIPAGVQVKVGTAVPVAVGK